MQWKETALVKENAAGHKCRSLSLLSTCSFLFLQNWIFDIIFWLSRVNWVNIKSISKERSFELYFTARVSLFWGWHHLDWSLSTAELAAASCSSWLCILGKYGRKRGSQLLHACLGEVEKSLKILQHLGGIMDQLSGPTVSSKPLATRLAVYVVIWCLCECLYTRVLYYIWEAFWKLGQIFLQ